MRAFYDTVLKIEAVLAGVLLMMMVGLIFLGGVARMMAMPLNWTIDLASCSFAWAAFLCADIAWRKDLFMSIEMLVERAPERVQRWITLFNYALIAAFLIYLIYAGIHISWVSRARSFQGIPGVSYSWVTASLPAGSALMLITTILKVRTFLRSGERPSSELERGTQ